MTEAAGFCNDIPRYAAAAEPCQHNAVFHLTDGFQLVDANAVHTLQKRITAGQQQRAHRGTCEKFPAS